MRHFGRYKEGQAGTRFFFLCYFAAVLFFFLFGIIHSEKITYESYAFGSGDAQELKLTDADTLELVFLTQQENAWGLTLDDYYDGETAYEEEYLTVDIVDLTTNETDQRTTIRLADQYSEALYSSKLYVPFDRSYPAGTKLRAIIRTHGIDEAGGKEFSLGTSSSSENAASTILDQIIDPEVNLCASVHYKASAKDLAKPILLFVVGLLAGGLLLYLNRALKLPVRAKKGRKPLDARQRAGSLQAWGTLILIAGILLIFWDYVATFSVERLAKRQDAAFLCSDRSADYMRVVLKDGEEISQIVKAEKDDFSGIAVWIDSLSDESGWAQEEAETEEASIEMKGKLVCQVYDTADDSLVVSVTEKLEALPAAAKAKPYDLSGDERKLIKNYRWLDFGTVIRQAAGHHYRIVLSTKNVKEGVALGSFYGEQSALRLNGEQGRDTLCLITLYKVNGDLTGLYRGMCLLLTILLFCVYGLKRLFGVRAGTVFLPCFLVLGLVFSFLIPPYCVPDERAHIDSAYIISNQILGIEEDAGPSMTYMRADDIAADRDNTMTVSADMYTELADDLLGKVQNAALTPVYVRDAVRNVTKLHYLPAAMGFALARLLGLNRITMIMFGRWLNLLVTGILLWLSVRKIPAAKDGFAILAMLPIVLQQSASCSYDGLILGGAFLFISYCLALLYQDGTSVTDWLVMLLAAGILSTSKGGVYIPVLGMILLIPFHKKHWSKRGSWFVSLASVSLAGCLFVGQFLQRLIDMLGPAAQGTSGTVADAGDTKLYTLGYFLKTPKQLIRILQNTVYVKGDHLFGELLGNRLGKLNIWIPWFLLVMLCVLLIRTFRHRGAGKSLVHPAAKAYIALLVMGGVLLVTLSMLLSWTAFGLEYVDGLQGRYYLPYLVMAALLLCKDERLNGVGEEVGSIWVYLLWLHFAIGNMVLSIYALL